jgi:hypothetical protein
MGNGGDKKQTCHSNSAIKNQQKFCDEDYEKIPHILGKGCLKISIATFLFPIFLFSLLACFHSLVAITCHQDTLDCFAHFFNIPCSAQSHVALLLGTHARIGNTWAGPSGFPIPLISTCFCPSRSWFGYLLNWHHCRDFEYHASFRGRSGIIGVMRKRKGGSAIELCASQASSWTKVLVWASWRGFVYFCFVLPLSPSCLLSCSSSMRREVTASSLCMHPSGWVLAYHGVRRDMSGEVYRTGILQQRGIREGDRVAFCWGFTGRWRSICYALFDAQCFCCYLSKGLVRH